MPPKELKPCTFIFSHNQKRYFFRSSCIYDAETDDYICQCDLTVTNYYGNEEVMIICCKIALDAYVEGITEGQRQNRQAIREALGL